MPKGRGNSRRKNQQHLKIRFKRPKRGYNNITTNSIGMGELKKSMSLNEAADCYAKKKCKNLDEAKKKKTRLLIMARKHPGQSRKKPVQTKTQLILETKKLIVMHLSKWPTDEQGEQKMKKIFTSAECCRDSACCGNKCV